MSETPGLVFLDDMDNHHKQPGFFRLYGKLLVLLFLVVVGAIAVFFITESTLSYKRAGAEYERLKKHVRVVEDTYDADPGVTQRTASGVVYPDRPAGAVLEIDFDALCAINPDTAAWLHVPALQISYPVVDADNRDYYTTHTFEGTRNANGAIFIEPFNRVDFTDRNTFVYGHNSADGSMFGTLHEFSYLDAQREKEPYVYVYLRDGTVRKYRIYSFYINGENSESFRTIDEEGYDAYVKYTKQVAEKVIAADFSDRPDLLTLSTCHGDAGTDERYLVHAVRVAQ